MSELSLSSTNLQQVFCRVGRERRTPEEWSQRRGEV
jgi:hypothetical protein